MADHGHGADHGDLHHGFGSHEKASHHGLIGGVSSAGMGYAEHAHGHHGALGHHGISGFGNVAMTDALTAGLALDLALGHGGHHHGGHHHHGKVAHIGHVHAHNAGNKSDPGRRVFDLPGVARDVATVTVLKWPHRPADTKKHIEAVATRLKLVRGTNREPRGKEQVFAPRRHDGNKDVDDTLAFIASKEAFTKPETKTNPPNMWYKGANGRTVLWRRYWQDPRQAEKWRTYIVESGVTWLYGLGDAETMVSFAVWSKGFVQRGYWTFFWDEIATHRSHCERMGQEALAFLDRHPVLNQRCIEFRRSLTPEQLELDVPKPLREPKPPVPSTVMPVQSTFVGGNDVMTSDGKIDSRI